MPNDYENPKYTNKNEYHAGDGPFQFPWWAIVIAFVVWWPLGLVFIGLNAAMKNGRLGGFEQKAREATRDRTASGAKPVYNAEFRPIYDTPAHPQPKAAAPHVAPQQAQVRAAGKKLKGAALATGLTVAGVLNVILNLVFVIGCGMAAEGVAIASAIAQWVSALLIIIHLLHRKDACRLDIRRLRLHHLASKRVLLIGIPSGLQNAIFAVANLFVQAGLNSFDEITVSGAAAAANADTLVFNMMAAFYTACASFVSRNWGAGRKERILKSYYISMLYAAVVGVLVGVLLTVFGREFLGLFADKPEVIDAGVDRLRIMAFSYWIGPLMDASIAASRGLGRSVAPPIMVILGSCVFRVIWIYTIFAYFHTITSLYLLYMFSWILTGVAEYIYFRITYKRNVLTARATW